MKLQGARIQTQGLLRLSAFTLTLLVVHGCAASGGTVNRNVPAGSFYSTSVITAEQIQMYPAVFSVEDILERHSSAIHLRRRHEPGGQINVSVRGMGTPLFVIDGVPLDNPGPNIGLNPQDIEYIEIVKDGGATAMWGLRGANGVISIRTKRY